MQNDLRYELQNILSGKSQISFGTTIQALANYLKNDETTSPSIEIAKHFKSEESERLENYILQNDLWVKNIDLTQYVSEGAEQKVYLKDSEYVFKLNDSIYYNFIKAYLLFKLFFKYLLSYTAYEFKR